MGGCTGPTTVDHWTSSVTGHPVPDAYLAYASYVVGKGKHLPWRQISADDTQLVTRRSLSGVDAIRPEHGHMPRMRDGGQLGTAQRSTSAQFVGTRPAGPGAGWSAGWLTGGASSGPVSYSSFVS